jgi:hypothetical protein
MDDQRMTLPFRLRLLVTAGLMVLVAVLPFPTPAGAGRTALDVVPVGRPVLGAPITLVSRSTSICGTRAPSASELEGVRAALGRWREEDVAAAQGGTIRVAFHVIAAHGVGQVSDAQLAEQIEALNRDFAPSGYRFEISSVDRTEEPGWLNMTPGSSKERKAKQALAIDPARHLNIYLCGLGPSLNGWSSLPWSEPEGHYLHGVVLDYATLSSAEPGLARAASHEVAHYLGLLPAEGAETAVPLLGGADIERMHQVVPVYHPSLFTDPPAASAIGTPEISPAAGAEPEDGHVLSYRGAFPNPFRAETALRFTLPISEPVSLRIYSVTGQLVRTLVDATLPAGDHSAMFRADGLPSGAYFAVLKAGSVQMSRTLMLIR